MMSPKQSALYWREWAAVRAYCKTHAFPDPDRHAIHRQALGRDKSSKAFTNRDVDLVLAAFRAISDPDSLRPQMSAQNQPRKRMLWKLFNDLLPQLAETLDAPDDDARSSSAEHYVLTILRDKYHASDPNPVAALDTLSDHQLQLLLVDLTRCITRRNEKTEKLAA